MRCDLVYVYVMCRYTHSVTGSGGNDDSEKGVDDADGYRIILYYYSLTRRGRGGNVVKQFIVVNGTRRWR